MPLMHVCHGKRRGWKWGKHGKPYFGAKARERAEAQMRAAYANGYKGR